MEEGLSEEDASIGGETSEPSFRFGLSENDVAFFVEARTFDNFSDIVVRNRRGESVENREDETFTERHLEADVFTPGSTHHSRGEKFHGAMGVAGLNIQKPLDFSDPFHVRELFGRLPCEEARCGESWRTVEPVAALDAGHFPVKELVEYPAEESPIAFLTRVEVGISKVILQFISLDQHMFRVYNLSMTAQITEWTDRTGRAFPRLEAHGKSLTEAFQNAAHGFFGLFTDVSSIRGTTSVTIFCESSDSDWLFSDWLNTLIYEVRERGMLFSEFHIEVDGINVKGVIRGEPIDPSRHPLRREFLGGAAFDELFAVEHETGAKVSAVLNDEKRHPLPLRELWR